MGSDLAPLVNLFQGYVKLDAKMFSSSSSSSIVGFAIVDDCSYGDCGPIMTIDQLQAKC